MSTPQHPKPLPKADALGHRTRFSDSSFYDEVCELCGTTDGHGGRLNSVCPQARPDTVAEMAHYLRSHADNQYIETPDAAKALLRYGADCIEALGKRQMEVTLTAKPEITINVESRRAIPKAVEVSLAELAGDVAPSAKTSEELRAQGHADHFAAEQQRTRDKKDADDFGVPLEIVVKARRMYQEEMARTHLFFMAEWNSVARFRKREYVRRAAAE